MEGENRIRLLGLPEDGGELIMHMVMWIHTPWLIGQPDYVITMPNMYARGILFGKMVLELGDTCVAKNEKRGLLCDLEFKTKVIYFIYILAWY